VPDKIVHANKDILFKVLSQLYQDKSLAVYGLDIPKIKRVLPTNYPAVTANEYRGDGAFLLEGDILYLQEYESTVEDECFLKYNRYICLALEQLRTEGIKPQKAIIGVIYTGDVIDAPAVYDIDALRIQIKQVFLSRFDTDATLANIKAKILSGHLLSDEDMLRLIILPLTQPINSLKQPLVEDAINLAKQLSNEKQQIFAIAGILTATNKFINPEYKSKMMEWIKMTQIARWFEEEKIEAINQAVKQAVNQKQNEVLSQVAKAMLLDGDEYLKVMKCTGLTRDEVAQIQSSLSLSA
jgi:hypothetical protein